MEAPESQSQTSLAEEIQHDVAPNTEEVADPSFTEPTDVAEDGQAEEPEDEEASQPEAAHAKPLLTIGALIEHLKSKGVMFESISETDATEYIGSKTYYFKIVAYRALFQKRVGSERDGQYVGIDFGRTQAALHAAHNDSRREALLPCEAPAPG